MPQENLVTNDNNPGSVKIQTENSSSKNSLEQKIESLGKEIKSLRKQNQLNSGIIGLGVIGLVGYIIATNWSAIAPALVAAGTAIAAAAPVIGIAIGAIIGAAVLVGASYAVWKYRAEIKAGFKYAAEKTVKGAEYTAKKVKNASIYTVGKIKDGAVRAKDSVKEAASAVGQATREGTGSALSAMGDKMSNLGRSMSDLDSIPYSMEKPQGHIVVLKTEEKTKNFNSVKEMFAKEVFGDKTVNSSTLTKKIFSELQGIILQKGYSVDGQQGFKKDQLISQLKHQADFVGKLDAKKLQKLLAQNDNNLYEIFSEYHSEIKGIIEKYRAEHTTDSLPGSSSTSSLVSTASSTAGLLNPEEHKKVKEPPKEPFSSDLGVLDNTATVEPVRVRTKRSPLSSSLGSGSPKLQEVTSPRLPESLEDEWSQFVNDRMKKHALSTQTNGNEGDLAGHSTPESTRSNSPGPVTNSTATVNPNLLRKNSFSSLNDGSSVPKEIVPPKVPGSPTSSRDSGINSPGPSTPEGITPESLTQALAGLKKIDSPYKSEQPSTHISEQKPTPVNQRLETLV